MEMIYLYQQEVMMNFFRTDKLGVYNNALNIYLENQIENSLKVVETFQKLKYKNDDNISQI